MNGEWSLICTGHNLLKLFRFGVDLHRKARVDGPAQRIRNFCRGSEHGAIRKAICGPAGATGKISCRDPLSLTRKVVRASGRRQEASSEAHERGTGRNRRERGCVPPPVSSRQHHTFDMIESVWEKATSLRPLTCSYERSPVGFPHRF